MSRKKRKAEPREFPEGAEESESPASNGAQERLAGVGLAAAALGLGLWLLQRTWLKWADVLVDYGRELYVPWRLVEGDVLYRDIAYFNGPLSPYWNALWFKVFGTAFLVQASVNLVLVCVFGVLFHRLLSRLGGPIAAGLVLCFALPVCVFAHSTGIGNYNFVSPYSHEMTHGFLLAILALDLAMRAEPVDPAGKRGLLLTGAALGLLFLTKAEIFAAAAAGIVVILGSQLLASKASVATWKRALVVVLGPTLAVPILAFLCLAFSMPLGLAGWSVLGSWTGIFGTEVSGLQLYQVGMGLDDPASRFGDMTSALGVLLLVFAPAFVLALSLPTKTRAVVRWGLAVAVGAGTFLGWHLAEVPQGKLALPLPLILFAVAILLWLRLRASAEFEARKQSAMRLGFVVFALAMLGKMILFVRFEHYGFVLTLPAMAVVILAATTWLPAWVRTRGGTGLLVSASVIGLCCAVAWDSWQGSEVMLARKKYDVGTGGDRILSESRGFYVAEVLKQIEQRFDDDAELLVIPEGVSINYWSRRKSPTAFTNFMPPELILYGEDTIVSALEASPPDGVILIHKNTAEYGFPYFGTDYGQAMMRWILANNAPTWLEERNGVPLQPGTQFGTAIMTRKRDQ